MSDDTHTTRVGGTATWAIELDTLDLRRKLTIRVALETPDSVSFVLRAIDTNAVVPDIYGVTRLERGQSQRDPHSFVAEIRTNDKRQMLGGANVDTVFIDAADSVFRGRVTLHGDQRSVAGEFAAPSAREAHPRSYASPEVQQAVLRRALEGFVSTFTGTTNGDGPADSTHSTPAARQFLESRWGGAAVIDSISASPQAYHVRLRGKSVALTCEVDSRDSTIRCG